MMICRKRTAESPELLAFEGFEEGRFFAAPPQKKLKIRWSTKTDVANQPKQPTEDGYGVKDADMRQNQKLGSLGGDDDKRQHQKQKQQQQGVDEERLSDLGKREHHKKLNVSEGGNFEFVKILKESIQPVDGLEYYINFEGKNSHNARAKFECRLLTFLGKKEVRFCRPEQNLNYSQWVVYDDDNQQQQKLKQQQQGVDKDEEPLSSADLEKKLNGSKGCIPGASKQVNISGNPPLLLKFISQVALDEYNEKNGNEEDLNVVLDDDEYDTEDYPNVVPDVDEYDTEDYDYVIDDAEMGFDVVAPISRSLVPHEISAKEPGGFKILSQAAPDKYNSSIEIDIVDFPDTKFLTLDSKTQKFKIMPHTDGYEDTERFKILLENALDKYHCPFGANFKVVKVLARWKAKAAMKAKRMEEADLVINDLQTPYRSWLVTLPAMAFDG